jgi:5-methylcytosine-specific restriction endonuclease McrA
MTGGGEVKLSPHQPTNEGLMPTPFSRQTRDYVRDIEAHSGGIKVLPQEQRLVKEALQTRRFEKMDPAAAEAHRTIYRNKKVQDSLKKEWSEKTGREWPSTPTGKIDPITKEPILAPHQAHHIIPQQLGGPHEWWNIHPIPLKGHQGGVHGSGSPLNKILKDTKL